MRKLLLTAILSIIMPYCMIISAATAAINSATAAQLAEAMDIDPDDIVTASLGTSDTNGAAVSTDTVGKHFPRKGSSFIILSTGHASIATNQNDGEGDGSVLGGLNNSEGQDMVQLTLELTVPTDATCVSFDFMFYSEEFDEYVGSSFNDAFTAELGNSTLSIENNKVIAPKNFAFDTLGDIISVNTVYGVTGETETTYDGATPKIRATTPIDSEATTITLVFSIQDLGDSIFDSAVFIDNFEWGINAVCVAGTFIDSDDDGIQDRHEIFGVDLDDDGTIDLDLPAMGADPNHKDIFIEIDYMENGAHSHQPKQATLQKLIDAFANAPVDNPDETQGINLHIDAGIQSIMNPETGEKWGTTNSNSNGITHTDNFGSTSNGNYNWSDFDAIKSANFSSNRAGFFRYGLFVHNLGGLGTSNGIERAIPSTDFIVSLGSWTNGVGTVHEQTGSFMHILGHTLGLRHGGQDDDNYKPNYLSVMNHAFQTRGLRVDGIDGVFDFSRFDLSDLNESNLDESVGLNGTSALDNYGTVYFNGNTLNYTDDANDAIDWNNNGAANDTSAAYDINNDDSQTILTSQNDWDNLNYSAGVLGQFSISVTQLMNTAAETLTINEDNQIPTDYDVSVSIQCDDNVTPNEETTCTVTIENTGTLTDTYELSGLSTYGWGDFDSLSSQIQLDAGESTSIDVTMTPSSWAQQGYVDKLAISVESQNNSNLLNSGEYNMEVTEAGTGSGNSTSLNEDNGRSGGCFINGLMFSYQ